MKLSVICEPADADLPPLRWSSSDSAVASVSSDGTVTGIAEGTALAVPTVEFILKDRELGDPMINGYDVLAMQLATEEEIETLVRTAFRVNEVLTPYFKSVNTDLIDMELVFGRGKDGVVLTGELSPDTMRLWDSRTHEKLDKDRFRKGLGNVGDAYREMFGRLNIGRV